MADIETEDGYPRHWEPKDPIRAVPAASIASEIGNDPVRLDLEDGTSVYGNREVILGVQANLLRLVEVEAKAELYLKQIKEGAEQAAWKKHMDDSNG
jgi:hypothetical protein